MQSAFSWMPALLRRRRRLAILVVLGASVAAFGASLQLRRADFRSQPPCMDCNLVLDVPPLPHVSLPHPVDTPRRRRIPTHRS